MLDLDSMLAVQLHDLVVSFDDQIVLDHLDLDVPAGKLFGLVGASGAGKSVLLRAILGLIPRREGRIEIFGLDRVAASAEELGSSSATGACSINKARSSRRSPCFKTLKFRCVNTSIYRPRRCARSPWRNWRWSGSLRRTATSFPPPCRAA